MEKGKSIIDHYKKYKLLIKAMIYWRLKFPDFPNPHIRTNAFMINRKLMLRIKYKRLKNKFMAYIMESGRNSITKQVLSMGFDVVVIDRWGGNYNIEQWPDSKTFWIDDQQNLLISDNQTRLYEKAEEEEKSKLAYLAWGRNG